MIFISYPQSEFELASRVRSELKQLGVDSWIYSEDKKLSEDSWLDIEKNLMESDHVIFIISEKTETSEGQIRELGLIKKWKKPTTPVWVGDTPRSVFPEFESISGERVGHGYLVRFFTWKLYNQLYPVPPSVWRTPKPGDFLRVIKLDGLEGQDINLDDLMYFRQLSPMGLFECFHVRRSDLFWIIPDNVEFAGYGFEEPEVPKKYRYESLIEAQVIWWGKINSEGMES